MLTNCEIKNTEEAIHLINLYPDRWGVEVGNDILKNAMNIESLPISNKNEFTKAIALAGPVAMQVANWVALSRKQEPPKVEEIFEKETLQYLEHCMYYFNLPIPKNWTMKSVINALGKLGGGDVRKNRLPGWRIVLRGWQRFVEFKDTMKYTLNAMAVKKLTPVKKEPDP